MQRLLPGSDLDTDALAAAYAYPGEMPRGRWLRANMVGTADGAAMGGSGVTRAISNDNDLNLLLLLRALSDVVLVGPRTVREERYGPARVKPEHVTARGGELPPPIAIMTSSLDLDFDWPLFTEAKVPAIVFTAETAPADAMARARKVAAPRQGDGWIGRGVNTILLPRRSYWASTTRAMR